MKTKKQGNSHLQCLSYQSPFAKPSRSTLEVLKGGSLASNARTLEIHQQCLPKAVAKL